MANREIKFRAWSPKRNKIVHHGIDGVEIYVHSKTAWIDGRDDEGVALMQFTGLKDKNGAEIYEGDIVLGLLVLSEAVGDAAETIGEVVYSPEYAAFGLKNHAGVTHFQHHIISSFEIAGNIYQNPDLI